MIILKVFELYQIGVYVLSNTSNITVVVLDSTYTPIQFNYKHNGDDETYDD